MIAATQQPVPRGTPHTPVPESEASRQARERLVDEELDESFPASDPPSWVQGTTPASH